MPCFKTKKAKTLARLEEDEPRVKGRAEMRTSAQTSQPIRQGDVNVNVKGTAAADSSPVKRIHQLVVLLQRKLQELNKDKQTSKQYGKQLKALYESLASADRHLKETKPTSKKFGACVREISDVTTQLESLCAKIRPGNSSRATSNGQPSHEHTVATPSGPKADFDQLISGCVQRLVDSSQVIGGDLALQARALHQVFVQQSAYLSITATCSQPDQAMLQRLLAATSHFIQKVQNIGSRSRDRQLTNHLKTLSESVAALGWVTVAPTPAPHVKEMTEAGQYWLNRVLKEHKGKEQHKAWCDAWKSVFSELHSFVKQHYTTGVTWNAQGRAVTDSDVAPVVDNEVLEEAQSKSSAKKDAKAVAVKEATPVMELQAKRWMVEHHTDNPSLVVSGTKPSQSVYVYKCERCTVQVKGKVNSIVMDNCKRVGVVFTDVISSVEFVNCQSVQGQATGKCQTISVEKTDGCELYATPATEIITAKSSSVNVLIPEKSGDFAEHAVPEQFKSTLDVKTRKLRTAPTEISA